LINSENINLIKKGAYLVNTARGGLEEECFIKEEAQLLSKEFPKTCDLKTVLQNHILLQQKNVIITPHNAFNSQEALMRILDTTVENIKGFMAGESQNIIKYNY